MDPALRTLTEAQRAHSCVLLWPPGEGPPDCFSWAHLKSESQGGSLGDILEKQDPGHAGEELSSPTDAADATHR